MAKAKPKRRKGASPPHGEPTRVTKVELEGLFGLYNHAIELRRDDRVTILHGVNGVGKTAVLRLLAAALSGRYSEFSRYPFALLRIVLADGAALEFRRTRGGEECRITVTSYDPRGDTPGDPWQFPLGGAEISDWAVTFADELGAGWLRRLGSDRWFDRRFGDEVSSLEIVRRYGGARELSGRRRRGVFEEPAWLMEARQRVAIHLIETQRLFRVMSSESTYYPARDTVMLPTVRDYARDLSERIKNALARYGTQSQSLDQSFPQRLIRGADRELSIEELKARMADLEALQTRFQKLGLLEVTANPFDMASLDDLEHEKLRVMSLYVEDTHQKLEILVDIADRISLLLENVNQKFRHKSIQIERDKGFVARGHDDVPLDPDSLSSGEQHELVLLYDLLFRVPKGALVLIDEPELSLHLVWQKRFLDDLLKIVKIAELDALIATHSPFIVGDRLDLMVELGAELKTTDEA